MLHNKLHILRNHLLILEEDYILKELLDKVCKFKDKENEITVNH